MTQFLEGPTPNPPPPPLIRGVPTMLKGYMRSAVLSFDEIKIQENLGFDKYTGDLASYVC